jgi:3-dehydroquinate synthase
VGLPTTYRGDRWVELYEGMKMDKKTRGATLRFIVLDDISRPGLLSGPDPALLHAAYAEISEAL